MEEVIRIDKYLWAIRMYKTRNQAAEACRGGKVLVGDQAVKPSREVKIGNIITIRTDQLTKTIKVTGLIENRVSAKLAAENYDDQTPKEEYERLKTIRETNFEIRERGIGRPSKKERRLIEKLKKYKY
jgi:ribosome-associated heat shock protein Hsp15